MGSPITQLEKVLSDLEKAIGEGRELVREMHAANKDMRTSIKEWNTLKAEYKEIAEKEVSHLIGNELKDQMMEMTAFQQTAYGSMIDGIKTIAEPLVASMQLVEDAYIKAGVPINRAPVILPPTKEQILKKVREAIAEQDSDV